MFCWSWMTVVNFQFLSSDSNATRTDWIYDKFVLFLIWDERTSCRFLQAAREHRRENGCRQFGYLLPSLCVRRIFRLKPRVGLNNMDKKGTKWESGPSTSSKTLSIYVRCFSLLTKSWWETGILSLMSHVIFFFLNHIDLSIEKRFFL